MKSLQIAIDGPASAGKSTIAKIIAQEKNYIYLDTGAMYRATTWAAIQNNVSFSDEAGLLRLLETHNIHFKNQLDGQHVFWDDEDITMSIRQDDVSRNVSEVSAHPKVRAYLVKEQQRYAQNGGVVMDGRDIGTAVLPHADVKIFLIASVEERAERRYKENLEKGIPCDLETLKEDIAKRDHLDSTREVSPLVKADDAIEVDTTGISIDGVVAKINCIIDEKI